MKVFVPFSEALSLGLIDALGLESGDLVPFQLEYPCVRAAVDQPDQTPSETPVQPDA